MKARSLILLALLGALVLLVSACGGGGGGSSVARTLTQSATNSQPTGGGSQPVLSDTISEITGTVVDVKGNPAAGLEVSVDSSAISAVTDAQGVFSLPGVAAGVHNVAVGKDGYTIVTRSLTLADGASLTLASSAQKGVSDAGTGTGQLHGVVSDESSNPIGGAMVIVFNADGYFQVQMSGDDGAYRFADLPAGNYFILSFKPGYQSYFDQVGIEAGVDKELNITLKSVGTGIVNGTVYDEANNPIAHAAVFLITRNSPTNRTPNFFMFSGGDGKFEFNHVPAGPALLVGFHPGYEPDSKEITVNVGETTTQDLVLKGAPGASLHGMVVDENKTGIAGATVTLIPGGRDSAGQREPNSGGSTGGGLQTTTDANGNYVFEHLPPGLYIGKASKDGFDPTIEPVHVLPRQGNEHNFILHPHGPPPPTGFGHIFGHVNGAGTASGTVGDPIPGATVDLYDRPLPPPNSMVPPPVPIRTTTTDDTGLYKFMEVPAFGQERPYFLVAHKDGFNPSGPKPAYVFPQHGTEVNFILFPFGPPPPQGFGHIYGHVFAGGPDPATPGTPLPCATVDLYNVPLPPPGSMAPMPMPYRSTRTDTTGLYKFMDVPAYGQEHPYFLIAHKDGYLPSDPKPAYVFPQQGTEVNFWLAPGPPPPNGFGNICGYVYAAGNDSTVPGNPIPGAAVDLFDQPLPPPGSGMPNVPPIRTTQTNQNGTYWFNDVPARPDPYFLVAHKDGFLPSDPKPAVVFPGQGTRVDFILIPGPPPPPPPPAVPIHGTVWCTGNPAAPQGVSGVNVYAAQKMFDPAGVYHGIDFNHIFQTVTGPDGGYQFFVPPGPYTLWTHKEGWTADIHDVPVGPNGASQDFFIHPLGPDAAPATFAGHVKTPASDPIPGAHVILAMVPPPGWMGPGWFIPVKDTFTGPLGGFAFDQIVPDGYLVVIQKDGFMMYAEARAFQPGDNQTAAYILYPVQPPPPPNP